MSGVRALLYRHRDFNRTILPIDVPLVPSHHHGTSVIVVSDSEERASHFGDIVHCPLELDDDTLISSSSMIGNSSRWYGTPKHKSSRV